MRGSRDPATDSAKPSMSWLPDRDLEFPADDAFGVDRLIGQLVEQLVDARPPFAVSLSGSWGVGKSTIAREVVKGLRKQDVRCVYLDVWTLDVRHLRRHLVVEIGGALESSDRGVDPEPEIRRKFALEKVDNRAAQTTEQGAAKVELRTGSEMWDAAARSLGSLVIVAAIVMGLVAAGAVLEDVHRSSLGRGRVDGTESDPRAARRQGQPVHLRDPDRPTEAGGSPPASPVLRSNPGFVGFGRTAGGAREFDLPNMPMDDLLNISRRIVQ